METADFGAVYVPCVMIGFTIRAVPGSGLRMRVVGFKGRVRVREPQSSLTSWIRKEFLFASVATTLLSGFLTREISVKRII